MYSLLYGFFDSRTFNLHITPDRRLLRLASHHPILALVEQECTTQAADAATA